MAYIYEMMIDSSRTLSGWYKKDLHHQSHTHTTTTHTHTHHNNHPTHTYHRELLIHHTMCVWFVTRSENLLRENASSSIPVHSSNRIGYFGHRCRYMGRRQVHRSQGTLIDRGLSSDGLYILSRISRARATVYMYYFFCQPSLQSNTHNLLTYTFHLKKKSQPIPSNSRFYSEWDHQMWLRDERLKKEAADRQKQTS